MCKRLTITAYLAWLTLLISCGTTHPKREMRAAWVATVVNIDWPVNGSDPLDKKKQDYINLLETFKRQHFNALVVQVRTAGDAFYPTKLAPWSRFLTGTEGEASKAYDSLLPWMIQKTHDYGMEFHAWINPYRATFDKDTLQLSNDHDFYRHRDWMILYGTKYYYDPGKPEVKEHLIKIAEEIVTKYNVDALHIDDYFYPYKIANTAFEDLESYETYRLPGQSIDDWRRSNVDSLIAGIARVIEKEKPWVQFGISPFGVWRNKDKDPKGSDSKAGQTTYDDLYADPLLWMNKGWVDYMVPQLYWSLDHPLASHRKISAWWNEQPYNGHLYLGNGAYKVNRDKDSAWHEKDQLTRQIQWARTLKNVDGNMFFSAKSFTDPANTSASQVAEVYQRPSLPPAHPDFTDNPNVAPVFQGWRKNGDQVQFTFSGLEAMSPRFIALYDQRGIQNGKAQKLIGIYGISSVSGQWISTIPYEVVQGKKIVACSVLDHFGRETHLVRLSLKP